MLELIAGFLKGPHINDATADLIARGVVIALIIVFSVLTNFLVKRPLLAILTNLIARTQTEWDNTFLEKKVLNQLAHLAPAMMIYVTAPLALEGYEKAIAFTAAAVQIYMIVVGILVINAFLNAVLDIYRTFEVAREIPIKGFIQVAKIVICLVGGIFIVCILMKKTPLVFLSGLGALTAILLLIFRDAILGFVAGIQLITNKMLARGDWIEMPKYGADGDVLDVALTTVKVQNWDKTITTIPTYALISNSFKNWRGMQESGGRRIKRSVYIDVSTIKLCTEEMLARFSKIQYISEYIARKKEEVTAYNTESHVDETSVVNGRRLSNIGTFRAYVVAYLKNHRMINQDMTFLVRQLAPTDHGLPLEVYVFCKDIVWANYEAIQADIFDHILAVVPEFDLRVFQHPSGSDFSKFASYK
ncbi:MAG: mechanosensitive ion channel family protein [Candidatus Poribacteria bacterium]|nr:mechanosensitive ion channel family protein [Candidatus Poribacteria bacterium]